MYWLFGPRSLFHGRFSDQGKACRVFVIIASRPGVTRVIGVIHSWEPYPYDYPDDFISIEVPYKTAFFEGNRCTGWEYIRDNR
jgi:hypothetical protein